MPRSTWTRPYPASSSLILSIGVTGAIGGIVGAIIGGILCDRLSQRDLRWQLWFPSLGAFASAPFMFAFVLWPESQAWSVGGITIPVAMVFMLGGGIIAAFWIGPTYAAIQNLAPQHQRTQASALFLFMFNLLGLGLGPLVIGILSDAFAPNFGTDSLRYAMAAGLIAVVLGSLAGYYGGRDEAALQQTQRWQSLRATRRASRPSPTPATAAP